MPKSQIFEEREIENKLDLMTTGFLITGVFQISGDGTKMWMKISNSSITQEMEEEDLKRIESIRKECQNRKDFWQSKKKNFGI